MCEDETMSATATFVQLKEALPSIWTPPGSRSASRVSPSGWLPLLAEMCRRLDAIVRSDPFRHELQIGRVLQKFRSLSVTWMARGRGAAHPDPRDLQVVREIHAVVLRAQEKSEQSCELCGGTGELRRGAPVMTLCNRHADLHARGLLEGEGS
jgi:hypothetical protein